MIHINRFRQVEYLTRFSELKQNHPLNCVQISNMISNMLYSRRWSPLLLNPTIVGLYKNRTDENWIPHISCMDLFGATDTVSNFIASGSGEEQIYAIAEMLYKPDMDQEELFEVLAQLITAGIDRDCVSGWGAVVNIM